MSKKVEVEVDTKTFIRFWLVIAALVIILFFITRAATGLIIVGISIFLAIAISPLARKIDQIDKKKKHPKLTAAIAYVLIITFIGVIIGVIGPVVVNETSHFIAKLPETFENTLGGWEGINSFGKSIGIENLQSDIYNNLSNFASGFTSNLGNILVNGVGTISSLATNLVLILVLTLLFLLEGPTLVKGFWTNMRKNRTPVETHKINIAERIVSKMTAVISTYVSNQAIVALLDGAVVTLFVFILSLIFNFSAGLAFPMGLLAFICYLIPMFGPVIGCIGIAALLAFSSPIAGLVFLIVYIVYSQIENNVIAPKIQGSSLKLSPVIVLVAITIGIYTFGILGAIISIPIAGCIKILIEEYPNLRATSEEKETKKLKA